MSLTAEDDKVITQRLVSKETVFLSASIASIASCWTNVISAIHNKTGLEIDDRAEKRAKVEDLLEKTLLETRNFGLDVSRNMYAAKISKKELQLCDKIQAEAEADIIRSRDEIVSLKATLKRAKTARRQRLEYEELAQVANQLPPKSKTKIDIDQLNEQINAANSKCQKVDSVIALRERQSSLLLQTIYELQSALKEEADLEIDNGATYLTIKGDAENVDESSNEPVPNASDELGVKRKRRNITVEESIE